MIHSLIALDTSKERLQLSSLKEKEPQNKISATLNRVEQDAGALNAKTTRPFGVNSDLLFGSRITGQGRHYEINGKTDPVLAMWAEKIWDVAKKEGLDPFPVRWVGMDRDTLISTTARTGFPVRFRHWSFGQAYQDLLLPQKHGHSQLYELVINTNPSYAYMLNENPLYAQKLVMAHVYGHTDFFKHNIAFQHTNRNMMEEMGTNASTIKKILDTEENVSFLAMENTLEHAMSLQWLIDLSVDKPRPLQYRSQQLENPPEVAKDFGVIDDRGYPAHIRKRINSPKRLTQERAKEQKRLDKQTHQNPTEPEADVMAFIIENSPILKPWQRDVLSIVRKESYYFAPQMKTKIMNEGWASFWHEKLMLHTPALVDHQHASQISKMAGGVVAGNPHQLNPYQLGVAMFRNILDRWDKGRHGRVFESIKDREEKKNYNTHEGKGMEKIFDVRKYHTDSSFINEFFNDEVAEEIKMYTWDPSVPDFYTKRQQIKVSSREVKETKTRLLEMLENGGQPLIKVVDGNFNNAGELLLNHTHRYDLDWGDAENTLKNAQSFWGRKVHLDTYQDINFKDKIPDVYIRILSSPDYLASLPNESEKELRTILNQKVRIKLRLTASKQAGKSVVDYHVLNESGKEIGSGDARGKLMESKLKEIEESLEQWGRKWLWK